MKISIASKMRFTENGKFGVFLFVFGPFLSAASYYWFMVEAARNFQGGALIPAIGMIAGSLGSLFGVALMIVGREFDHSVDIDRQS